MAVRSIDGEKIAHITPLIKNHSLDSSFLKNYRPISNLSFVFKLIERVILRRLNKHLADNMLNEPLQSAYKKVHSCETLLVRIVNDLLIASDENEATVGYVTGIPTRGIPTGRNPHWRESPPEFHAVVIPFLGARSLHWTESPLLGSHCVYLCTLI